MRSALALWSLLLASGACGFSPRVTGDALVVPPTPDVPPIPITLTISGTATARRPEKVLLEGATVELYSTSDDTTPLATTTTDANGTYSFTIMVISSLDGYL